MKRAEITVTTEGTCNLSGVRTQGHMFYEGSEDPDGTIHLVPACLVPAMLAAPGGDISLSEDELRRRIDRLELQKERA